MSLSVTDLPFLVGRQGTNDLMAKTGKDKMRIGVMKYFILGLLILVSLSAAYAQKAPLKNKTKSALYQGICGTVVEKRGNHMPSPDSPRPNPNGTPIVREVLIFPLLNMGQVETGENGFINSVRDAKPIKTVKSGKDGTFCVSLPVGQYSVLVQEPNGLYANLSDSHGNINPVSVEKGRKAQATVEITHQAVF
ncbi:MAG: hypothetical protein JWP57_4210 [Spirosoma sp.]|nr:hypothetical protein [Spirosoma sp.]